jgi:hypothetical protein
MKQTLLVEDCGTTFHRKMNELLKQGWYYIPDTMKVNMSADGRHERFVAMLVQDEESDAIVEAIKQQLAEAGGGVCSCPSDAHNGPVPPPFFQSPDVEPHSDDGLTQGKKK